jgi:opacity protein-like surface antigen
MKRLLVSALFLLAAAGVSRAQILSANATNVAAPFSARAGEVSLMPPIAVTTAEAPAAASAALPDAPAPRFGFGGSVERRWQIALGYEFVRFRSAPFDASLNGLHTDVVYSVSDFFGLEGSSVAVFATKKPGMGRAKYGLFTGGPRVSWHRTHWDPWAHVLVGFVHVTPQTALGGENAFALQVGGGADYKVNPTFSLRVEADWVRSQLYSDAQNNFQFGTGVVVHF